jgi:TonB family protein
MTTSIAVVENRKIGFEPTEITYRTIFYYLDASMAKMIQPGQPVNSEQPRANASSVQLPSASMNKLSSFTSIQLPGANLSTSNSSNSQPVIVGNDGEAPAPRILKPISGGVLNGKALSLPVPIYPQIAMRARTAGKVEVEVTVDETGKVISAQATAGPTALRDAAVDAAKRARFSPTKLSGLPVKVVGIINYNFTLP